MAPPAWFTPARLLLLLCACTLLLFGDRGILASNSVNGSAAAEGVPGTGIQGEFALSLVQDGLLATGLVTGLMFSAPVSAQLSTRLNAFRLIGSGLALWVAAAAGCAAAPGFVPLLLCRLAVGVGCGPFIALASPLVDDTAPPRQKSLWLACLFLCIPSGFALGYIGGGVIGSGWGWRAAFAAEAVAMAPLAAACLLLPAVDIRRGAAGKAQAAAPAVAGAGGEEAAGREAPPLAAEAPGPLGNLCHLAANPVVVLTILGLSLFTGALGCFSFFGPKAARETFDVGSETADILFGAITVATGVAGTLAGGVLLDALGASVRTALALCGGGMAAGALLVGAAFAGARGLPLFSALFAAGELGMFVSAAPSNAVLLWSVPPAMRPFALSMAEVAQHVFGDIPSPPALGWLQGRLGDWRRSMCAAAALLGFSAALFVAARTAARPGAADYRELEAVEGSDLLGSGDEEEAAAAVAEEGGGGGGGAEALTRPLLLPRGVV